MEEMRENCESDLSRVPKNLQPHVFKKGQIGNPNGRPKGSISLKQYAKQMLENMTPDEREEYLHGLPKQFIWEMAEGKADTHTTLKATVDLNKLSELPDDELDKLIAAGSGGEGEKGKSQA